MTHFPGVTYYSMSESIPIHGFYNVVVGDVPELLGILEIKEGGMKTLGAGLFRLLFRNEPRTTGGTGVGASVDCFFKQGS